MRTNDEDNGDHLFVPMAAKWLTSGTDVDEVLNSMQFSPMYWSTVVCIFLSNLIDQVWKSIYYELIADLFSLHMPLKIFSV